MKTNYGFIRVAAGIPETELANPSANAGKISTFIDKAEKEDTSIIVFPELCVTGYSCGELFSQELMLDKAEDAVREVVASSSGKNVTAIIGAPVRIGNRLYNCAVVLKDGKILGIVPKTHLPGYSEFYENRWFSSGSEFLGGNNVTTTYAGQPAVISPNIIFHCGKVPFAVEICEDLWTPVPPSSFHALAGALLTFNLSASNKVADKAKFRRRLVARHSSQTVSGYVYCSSGYGESTQDIVYSGSVIIAANGEILSETDRNSSYNTLIIADIDASELENIRQRKNTFQTFSPDGDNNWNRFYAHIDAGEAAGTDFEKELLHGIDRHPFMPSGKDEAVTYNEVIDIQVQGLATRLDHIGCRSAVIGVSGGLDSTLALIVTALSFDRLGLDRKGITAVTMPGYGTSGRTHANARKLMEALGVTVREISIAAACDQHFIDIGHDKNVHDTTFENSQARERTQILMDIANQTSGIVIGTGDMSELALGWATYNGDHMSMYGVNAGVPKTLVCSTVRWIAGNMPEFACVKDILTDIADTPVSPELLPAGNDGRIAQVTEDIVGPYELHDFFLYNLLSYGFSPAKIYFLARKAFAGSYTDETILKWLKVFFRRFFSQQFKRSCMPDGPKVWSVGLSPRGDWRMPSDASSAAFMEELERL